MAGLGLLASPFVISSIYIDRRGVPVQGTVTAKYEYVRVHNSSWWRLCEVTVTYQPPDAPRPSAFTARLEPAAYDALHRGRTVEVRYLPRSEIPAVPLAGLLSRINALPVARLAGRTFFTPLTSLLVTVRPALRWLAAGALLLVVWRIAGWGGFGWAVIACVVAGVVVVALDEIPAAPPAPAREVRQADGRVASVARITRMFDSDHSTGIVLDQPIDVVGVSFVPEGRDDAVLAIDVTDAGVLAEGAVVAVDYEATAPRTARIHSAARTFTARNRREVALTAAVMLAAVGGLFALASRRRKR